MSIEISDAEYQIMLAIWEASPVNAKDVLSRVPHPIPLANVVEKYPVLYEQVYKCG